MNPISRRLREAHEVFLPARTDAERRAVDARNTPEAAAAKRRRLAHLAEGGRVDEMAMPDTSDRFRAAVAAEAVARIRTTMIGAVAAIEDELGSLWGQGLSPHELTDDEAALRDVFARLRTRILDLGNAQRRAIEASFSPPHQDQ